MKVGLMGFSHTRLDDVDILLVSPNGKGVEILSDAAFGATANNVNITFDDSASGTVVGSTVTTGTYRPTDSAESSVDTFPAPAPLRPYHAVTGTNALSNFNGFSPNGDWRLFVVDDLSTNSGSISGGWFLDITTTPGVPPTQPACGVAAFSPTNF
ncbi:MAG: proprotein convertase P-domain-containing protein, partial [Chitinophagales bacterium]|nr:proprotein convertase P-domain-containing protein [Chitinophagales bacterium]